MRHWSPRVIVLSGLLMSICLGSALSLPFWTVLLIRAALPTAQAEVLNQQLAEPLQNLWPVGTILGGGVWGWAIARWIGFRPVWRMALASGLSVGLGHLFVTSATYLDFANDLKPEAPLHIRFAIELVLALALGAGLLGLSLGLAIRKGRIALRLALASSMAAAIPASIVVAVLDLLGVRVGSGHAAMAKAVSLAFPAAAVTAGAVIGQLLVQFRSAATFRSRNA